MRIIVLALALCLFPAVAAAEVERQCPREDQDCIEYTFGNERVDGTAESGAYDRTAARRSGSRERLVRVRTDFLPELYKSVEQI